MIWVLILAGAMVSFGTGTVIGYNTGKTAKDHEWQVKENDWLVNTAKLQESHEAEIKSERDKNTENLMRVINEKQQAQAKLDNAMHQLAIGGMFISTEEGACRDAVSREAESASKSSNAANASRKVRIHGKSEQDIREMIRDAQELANRHKELRAVCLPLLDIVE